MDCTFKTSEGRFNYRVGAIIINDSSLLLTTNLEENFYYSVGGRVKMNETMDAAIEREVLEETNSSIIWKKLAFIHENFFTSSLTEEKYHELSMYYYVKLADYTALSCQTRNEFGAKEQLEWIPLRQLVQTDIRPAFLKELALDGASERRHIVTEE